MPTIISEGEKFRPSDWIERLACNFSTFTNNKLVYSSSARPMILHGQSVLYLADGINQKDYDWLTSFAKSNNLNIQTLDK